MKEHKYKSNKIENRYSTNKNRVDSTIKIEAKHCEMMLLNSLPEHSIIERFYKMTLDPQYLERYKYLLDIADKKGVDIEYKKVEVPLALWGKTKNDANQEKELVQFLEVNKPQTIVFLDGITDPHNAGACLRSIYCSGISTVIIPRNNTAPMNSTVVKTSGGTMPFINIFTINNFKRALSQAKSLSYWLYGADVGEDSVSLFDIEFNTPTALIMGSEGNGIKKQIKDSCDVLVKIPQVSHNIIDSLNVSVATGIIAMEIYKQNTMK